MSKRLVHNLLAGVLLLAAPIAPATAQNSPDQSAEARKLEIGFIKIDKDITLRRMVVRSAKPKGTVVLLHGFPETAYAWHDIAQKLGEDLDVHAFDWPGFGQSSRPSPERFAYAPRDFARVLRSYIDKAHIDRSTLTIYATDIGGLPALLAALDEPTIAKTIIVGDFAPFNRPGYMHPRLQRLKSKSSAGAARAELKATRDETLEHAFKRGLPEHAQFRLSQAYKDDMLRGWGSGDRTAADAFYHYYSHFTRDEDFLEANLAKLATPIKVVWGEDDIYISKDMGREFAKRIGAKITLIPGVGHYLHLQAPQRAIEEIRETLP